MNVSEMNDIGTHDVSLEPVVEPADAALDHDECDQCGAPVDSFQRYCVNCGAHRHHVPDPAARYLAQASARARVAGSRAARPPARRRSSLSPLTAALLAAVIAGGGVAVGAAIEGGSGNGGAPASTGAAKHAGKAKTPGSAATRLQHATGKSYIHQAQQLPNKVSIP